jgi:predicted DNA-binding transcriptional regulator YafY
MRKAERLFQLVAFLRGRRLAITAEALAEALEVSTRTVYRDIRALEASGVPIDGAAGVGYRLAPGFELPPIMFTRDEVLAILVGGRMVQAFTDPALGAAAKTAEAKVRASLDDEAKAMADAQPYRIPLLSRDDALRETHRQIREAAAARAKMAILYRDGEGAKTRRIVWPLSLIGWSGIWTLCAWCELREDYRNFRFDRIEALETLAEAFEDREDRSLRGYISGLAAE